VLTRQLARFDSLHPEAHVEIRRAPDDATQRHQLYVQWLNARVGEPDVLQLDVIWTPEFAAAGWILPLDSFAPPAAGFFPATIAANRWRDTLFALPWFVDVGLLYRRTDLVPRAPATIGELLEAAADGRERAGGDIAGIVWQGARYEGLITTWVEYLGAMGGRIMAPDGAIEADSPAAIRALDAMIEQLRRGLAPPEVLTWHEEETRFAFQNGRAVFMRNWPYAFPLLSDTAQSKVAGRFAVSPMPAGDGGRPSATLGGAQLAVNRYSAHPGLAYALVAYLTAPEQLLERAVAVGQYPPWAALYDDPRLAAAIPIPLADVRRALENATPRPVTPLYTELSDLLQVQLHRALTGQASAQEALRGAAADMRGLLDRAGMSPPRPEGS
jgi:multiple sugar transport system substrate-binding protein